MSLCRTIDGVVEWYNPASDWRLMDAFLRRVSCTNCGYKGSLWFKKGTLVESLLPSVKCSECDCEALVKAA